MMRRLLSLLFAVAANCASHCDTEPLSLPFRDVQVLPNVKNSLMKGIPATIGSPSQNIVLLPWAYVKEPDDNRRTDLLTSNIES